MMTKRERVLCAMNNQPVDRPPVGFWFHFTGDRQLGSKCVDAHLEYYNNIDVDIAKIMCDGYFDYPNPAAKKVQKPEDWYKLEPLGAESDFIRGQVERAKAIRRGLAKGQFVLYNVFAPFSTISSLWNKRRNGDEASSGRPGRCFICPSRDTGGQRAFVRKADL